MRFGVLGDLVATEALMQGLLRQTAPLAQHCKRQTIFPDSLQLALQLREELWDRMACGVFTRVYGPQPAEPDEWEKKNREECRQNVNELRDIYEKGPGSEAEEAILGFL